MDSEPGSRPLGGCKADHGGFGMFNSQDDRNHSICNWNILILAGKLDPSSIGFHMEPI